MCLLAVCETNSLKKEYFDEAFKTNNDGFGFAFREKSGEIYYQKGHMEADEAWETYNKFVKEHLVYPHVVHFRLGNPVCEELTHPFEISETSELNIVNKFNGDVLFHNGVVTGWKDRLWDAFMLSRVIPDGKFSDTRVIAILYHHFGKNLFDFIDGKFVVFGKDKLEYYGEFSEEDGIKFSNKSYVPVTRYYSGNSSYTYRSTTTTSGVIDEFIV